MSEHNFNDALPLDEQPRLITMQVQVPDGRNGYVSLATNVDQWAGQSTIDGMLDKLMTAAERQRAKQQIPELQHELDGNQALLDENRIRLAEMEARYAEEKRIRDEKRKALAHMHADKFARAENEHFASGRQGEFKPKGHLLAELNAYDRQQKDLAAVQDTKDNEHIVAASQLDAEIKKREHSVAILSRRIAECEALINGTDQSADLRSGSQPS